MTEENRPADEALDGEEVQELPDREDMSLINANIAVPVNAAVAANVLSDGSNATAGANQYIGNLDQTN